MGLKLLGVRPGRATRRPEPVRRSVRRYRRLRRGGPRIPLPTANVDVTPARDSKNLQRLSEALTDLEARIRVAGIADGLSFAHSGTTLADVGVLKLVTRLGELGLVLSPAGNADFDQLAARQLVVHVHGVAVPLAALPDVIASKEAAGRPSDRYALPILRELLLRLDR